jgi:hypothetical protein
MAFFKPKVPIWLNFGGSYMEHVGIFYGHFVYFTAIWYTLWPYVTYILWLFGIFFPFWYVSPRKIWQP